MKVAVVDYGSGNLTSASRALALAAERAGLDADGRGHRGSRLSSAAPTGSCCRARAPSPIARAGLAAVAGMREAIETRHRPPARRSSASASACN